MSLEAHAAISVSSPRHVHKYRHAPATLLLTLPMKRGKRGFPSAKDPGPSRRRRFPNAVHRAFLREGHAQNSDAVHPIGRGARITNQLKSGTLPLRSNEHVVDCRQTVRRLAQENGFGLSAQTMLMTAASELARNTLKYGGGGDMTYEVVSPANRVGIRLVFEDRGPGIADIPQAMVDGWSSGGGLGLGLSGSKRLVHEFEIRSVAGNGTKVTVIRWK